MENKVKLTHKRWARVTAFVLFILLMPVILLSALDIAAASSWGWYDPEPVSFYDSSFCRVLADRDARYATYRYNDRATSNLLPQEPYKDARYSNFLYVLRDREGNVLEQNCDGESAVLVLKDMVPISMTDEQTGKVVPQYCTDAYVRAPIDSIHDDYWRAQMLFTLSYGLR